MKMNTALISRIGLSVFLSVTALASSGAPIISPAYAQATASVEAFAASLAGLDEATRVARIQAFITRNPTISVAALAAAVVAAAPNAQAAAAIAVAFVEAVPASQQASIATAVAAASTSTATRSAVASAVTQAATSGTVSSAAGSAATTSAASGNVSEQAAGTDISVSSS